MKRLSWNITVWNAVNAAAVVLYARRPLTQEIKSMRKIQLAKKKKK